jgi:glutamate-ammonia-ligase adenylyltransferase
VRGPAAGRDSDTGKTHLTRLGFHDPARALAMLSTPHLSPIREDQTVLRDVAAAPDPDLALLGLERLVERTPGADALLAAVERDDLFRHRLLTVLGASSALAEHCSRHPEHVRDLQDLPLPAPRPPAADVRAELLRAVGADPYAAMPVADTDLTMGADALRVAYRRRLFLLAARDVADSLDVAIVAGELADLADAALEAALAVARGAVPQHELVRVAVIGMGKCGGRELNYVSDVDVMFVVAGTGEHHADDRVHQVGSALATTMMKVCGDHTAEGTLWPVDAALRPEGKQGSLVRTLNGYRSYYERWAKTWEFQALLKARASAGDAELGEEFESLVSEWVWSASNRPGFVEDVQAMRRRVENNIPAKDADRQLKLGRGGLRDVEFSVQLLQLVHGRTDESLRSRSTLGALSALTAGGYVGRTDGGDLDNAYRFMRTVEHRMQLARLRRIHVVPSDDVSLRRIGRSLGLRQDPAGALEKRWRRHQQQVRLLHEQIFYRPLLAAVARIPSEDVVLSPERARERLEALGYVDPNGALRHIEAMTTGLSRRAAIQRTLLPAMLGWFADGPDPDAGLSGFRAVGEALGDSHGLLGILRDEPAAAQRLATVLSSSKYSVEMLLRNPEAVTIIASADELRPREREALEREAVVGAERYADPVKAIGPVRAMRRRELYRVSVIDVLRDPVGSLTERARHRVDGVSESVSAIAEATIAGAYAAAVGGVASDLEGEVPLSFGVVSMGRLGGREMGYASDADVMFVYEARPGADDEAAQPVALSIAQEMRRLLSLPSPEPPLLLDTALRPEGRQGPMVRSLSSYRAYYDRWAETWESQALLRADPLVGDSELLQSFADMIEDLRYPDGGLSVAQVREIRRIKARVESERLPRGANPSTHLKLGPGGLADVEWTAQLIQLQHAGTVAGLRTTRTREALEAAVAADLLDEQSARELLSAWRGATDVRNAVVLVSGRASDQIPTDPRTRAAVARVLGYEPGETDGMVDDYLRTARRARRVVERVFYGEVNP